MNKLDKLLSKVQEMARSALEMLFPPDEDGFLEAMGIDKEKYAVELPDGSTGYDFLQALNDTAADENWSEELNNE